MNEEFDRWFRDMPGKLQRKLAKGIKEIADDLANDIKAVAPQGPTGNLKQSVRVRRVRNTLEFVVEAGGPLTTKEIRKGSGEDYDYALAKEFGTEKQTAAPFFYTTANAQRDAIREKVSDLVADVLSEN